MCIPDSGCRGFACWNTGRDWVVGPGLTVADRGAERMGRLIAGEKGAWNEALPKFQRKVRVSVFLMKCLRYLSGAFPAARRAGRQAGERECQEKLGKYS